MPREARIVIKTPGQWINKHLNVVQPIQRLYDIWNPPPPNTNILSDLRLTVAKIQEILGEAENSKTPVRAVGGGWSLSTAAATQGFSLNTRPLNWYFPLSAKSVHTNYPGQRASLLFVQCGTSVYELHQSLAQFNRALKTCGASNGQTIIGATATGTHGAAFDVGAMQDYVVGLHIIAGSDRVVWLERASYPVVSDDFAARLGATVIRDDTMFHAAVVGFGSFGFIHAALIESEPQYLLEASRKRLPLDAALRKTMTTLDFANLPTLPHPGERPLHFEVVFNPHDMNAGPYVTVMYKRPYASDYPHPVPDGSGFAPGDDLLSVVGTLNDVAAPAIPLLVNGLAGTFYQEYAGKWGTLNEIFSTTTTFGKGMSMELGVAMEQSTAALDVIMKAHKAAGPFGGFIAFRFVKQSKALLAFTRFPVTCTIEFPGVYSQRSVKFYDRVQSDLDKANIPFTLHWGQMGAYSPERVIAMYGAKNVNDWKKSRKNLLSAKAQKVFTNDFLVQCGLG